MAAGRRGKPKGSPKSGGRAKGVPNRALKPYRDAIADFAKNFGPEAIETLAAIMRDAAAPHASRVMASDKILDRAYGKPPQAITGPNGGPIQTLDVSKLTDEQLDALEPVLAALARSGDTLGPGESGASAA